MPTSNPHKTPNPFTIYSTELSFPLVRMRYEVLGDQSFGNKTEKFMVKQIQVNLRLEKMTQDNFAPVEYSGQRLSYQNLKLKLFVI